LTRILSKGSLKHYAGTTNEADGKPINDGLARGIQSN
jgi:hypothetical protein